MNDALTIIHTNQIKKIMVQNLYCGMGGINFSGIRTLKLLGGGGGGNGIYSYTRPRKGEDLMILA